MIRTLQGKLNGREGAKLSVTQKRRARGSIRWTFILTLALAPLPGLASAQESEEDAEPIQNVQLLFHLVEADGFTGDDPAISDVVGELRKLFNFHGYRLLSTSMLNVGLAESFEKEGSTWITRISGSASQRIVADDAETPLTIRADVSSLSTTRVRAKVTLTVGMTGFLLDASVTLRDGQRVVLGSARRSADTPVLILIVTPRIDPT